MKTSIAFALLLTACATDAIDTSVDDYYTDGKADAFHPPRFETFVGKDGKYYFHLLASNGQKVLQSQGYNSLLLGGGHGEVFINFMIRNNSSPQSISTGSANILQNVAFVNNQAPVTCSRLTQCS